MTNNSKGLKNAIEEYTQNLRPNPLKGTKHNYPHAMKNAYKEKECLKLTRRLIMKKSELDDRVLALAQHLGVGFEYRAELSSGYEDFQAIEEIEEKMVQLIYEVEHLKEEADVLFGEEKEDAPETDAIMTEVDKLADDIAILQTLIDEDDPELVEDIEEGYSAYTLKYGKEEYIVATDDEADELWEESLDNYIESCLEIPEHLRFYFDDSKFKRDCKTDGRAHSLASYDEEEHEEEVNDTTYYIYRTN